MFLQKFTLNKLIAFLLIIILAPVVAGLYGIIHDQLTYTISPEYYTKFKFYQFGLMDIGNEAIFTNPRIQVSAVGFLATWWMGIPIGLILALVSTIHHSGNRMFRIGLVAFAVTIVIAFFTGLIGLAYGKFHLSEIGVKWWLPENLIDKKNFISVGSMHNFSYLGGLTGLIAGIIYIVKKKNKYAHVLNSNSSASNLNDSNLSSFE